ncbi:MAG: hypothetical protein IPH20_06740 [Bacteroidales bacterium]|nr:hypothetical protein [Bacteroidales bacterium]
MRKLMFISFLAAILFSTTGCKKDKDENEATVVSVKFDGNTWTANLSTAVYNSASGLTAVSAFYGSSQHLQIIYNGNTTGTYNLTTDIANAYCAFTLLSGDIYSSLDANANAPTGQIVVTKYDQERS